MIYDDKLNIEKLVGELVLNAFLKNGSILLQCENNVFQLNPYGDCCANCFIQHIDGSETLNGAIINEVETLQYRRDINDGHEDCDVVDEFGYRLHTSKGICTIEMRVEHNGYYGGELEVYKNATLDKGKPLKDF